MALPGSLVPSIGRLSWGLSSGRSGWGDISISSGSGGEFVRVGIRFRVGGVS